MRRKDIIIYGAGKGACEQIETWKTYFNIIAIVDKDQNKTGMEFYDFIIQPVDIISKLKYDFILVSTDNKKETEIRKQLYTDYQICDEKIINSQGALALAMAERRKTFSSSKDDMKVYDCFMFFNEFELLKLRFELLDSFVDYFVIVESEKTFKGETKSLLFKERMGEFEKYKDKIIYVCPQNIPQPVVTDDIDWTIEKYQRESIVNGLEKCRAEDLIIISDVDELPDPMLIEKIRKYSLDTSKDELKTQIEKEAVVLEQDLFYYYFNNKADRKWRGTILCKYKNLVSIQWLRDNRNRISFIKNGGWHFSYLGDADRIKKKLESISDGVLYPDDNINDALNTGKLLDERWGTSSFIPIEDIGIPQISSWKNEYPSFFKDV